MKPIPLSPAQRRIIELAARGLPDKAITGELNMAVPTVRSHWGRIFGKLSVRTRIESVLLVLLQQRAAPVLNLAVNEAGHATTPAQRAKVRA